MMKVLVVDDEYNKAQMVSAVLSGDGILGVAVEHVTTAQAARQALRTSDFDVLIIDLNLPEVIGAKPSERGGLALFDMIGLDEQVLLPSDVLFITAREDLIGEIGDEVASRGAQLLEYRENSEHWKKILVGRVRYAQQRRTRGRESQADVAIITALNRPELTAVLRLPYSWTPHRLPRDPTPYHFGRVPRPDREVTVVAAHAQRKGMPSSAALAARLAILYRPRYLLMLGICAGMAGKVGLGDVIVGDPAWDWGSGKSGQRTDGSSVFQVAPHQRPLDTYVSQLAQTIGCDLSVLHSISDNWTSRKPSTSLFVHVGPMASGARVIADEAVAVAIAEQHREVIAIEMEAYAVMAAAEYSADPKPIALAIKSVCDYADSAKNDDWQDYAAYTSAAFADHLLRSPDLRFEA
ncbi:MAG TPA: hypothetical protein DCQ94_20275 [Nitrospira sp.]|nr:hypothetical protein [Nitrospira sp.]